MESGTATTPEWVASELLVQFLDDLRDAGYNIGIQQYIAVQDLVLTLATQGELPDLRNLRSFIGPIVCSSAIEQIDFQERFDGWTKQLNLDDFRQLNLEDFRRHEIPEHNAKSLVEDLDRIQRGGKTLTRLLTGVVIICAVLLFPSHKLQKDIPLSHSTSTPLPEPTSATRPSNAPQPSEVPSPQPSEVPSPQPSEVPSLQPSEVPDPFSLETPLPPSSMVKNERFQWRAILFFGVVVATLLIWRFWWYRSARQFLNRRESNHSPELQKLSMQGIESSLFSSNLVFQTAQQLRRRTRQFANTLDIQQTLLASIKQGGWLTPIYCTKKTIPEYLFLIDRASYADHQAKLTEELIQQLQQNGVYIKRFFFDEDAQVCYPELQSHYPQSLQDLFSQYGRDRLVIVVEAEILFSHQTGKPKTWLDLLQAWEQRVLLTPNPVESWSQWELNLMQKFIVLPLTPQGIAAFPQIFLKGSTVYRLAETPSTPFPEMLAIRSQQWLGRYPPRAEKGQQMLSELATYLEESGLYWFAACAVFPELHWTITVYLGNVLKNTEGRALLSGPILSKLVRLPWFRYGYIPDWLRRYLVLNLTPDQNKAVRQAFRQLMVMAVRGDIGPLQLEIAQQYQQTLPNLTRPLLRLLSRQTSDEAPLRDFIFLDFMTKESLLTVAIPEDLKPLFHGSQYEKILRRQKLRLTVVIGFIFVSVGLYAWWTITAPTRHMNQLLHDARALTVANNHLDALVMLTQVGQMLRASNNQDSTILSSTTSLFLKNVSIRNNAVSSSPPSFHQHNQLNSHQAGVISVVFSPDGNTLISASEDNTIKLWDRSGKLLNSLKEHTDTVYSVAFSPDRNTLTSASRNGTIKLWDRSEELLNSLKGHIDTGYSVAFSPDRNTLASVSEDNTIKLWDRSGKLLNSLKGHTDTVISVAFSPDGNILASASEDNTIKLWDRSGKLLNTLKGHTTAVNNVAFSPDGNILASASEDNTIKLWDRSGKLLNTLKGHTTAVNNVAFSPDGNTLASASSDTTIKLWDQSGKLLNTLKGHTAAVNNVAFSPDGNTLASASEDNTIKLWNRSRKFFPPFKGHIFGVISTTFSPDGNTLASGSWDSTIKLWDQSGKLLNTLKGHESYVYSVAFSPDGNTLASGSWDSTIKLWDQSGKLLNTLKGHESYVYSVAFSPDGNTLASASEDNTIKLWDRSGKLLNFLKGHTAAVYSVAFSPDGNILASASEDNTIKLWDRSGKLLNTLKGHTAAVNSVAFSPDGNILASASEDNTIKLWDRGGKLLNTLKGHTTAVNNVAFSPDGNILASASEDNTIKLWDRSGKLLNTLKGHTAAVNNVAFSPDGNILASASSDTTIKLWPWSIDLFVAHSCNWLKDYLLTNPNVSKEDKELCGL